jgi:hypothetical protein
VSERERLAAGGLFTETALTGTRTVLTRCRAAAGMQAMLD